MDFSLNDDQLALIDGVASIVQNHIEPPRDGNVAAALYQSYGTELEKDLESTGFLELGSMEGLGPADAVLVIEQIYRAPAVVEIGATTIVAPRLMSQELPRPIALARTADLPSPIRFLDIAQTLIVDMGDEAAVVSIAPGDVEAVDSIYGYNFGAFKTPPDLSAAQSLGVGSGDMLRQWWQVTLAAECGAAMDQILERTVEYVKERRQFGVPIGSFQAIKHRLADDAQRVESLKWMARKAAWSGEPEEAASAALYAQMSVEKICNDAHQFHGAIGLTLEDPLHYWTMRLRALQSELGGSSHQALDFIRHKEAKS